MIDRWSLSRWPYKDMLGVLSSDVNLLAFGPVRPNTTKGSHHADLQSNWAAARRQGVLAADMLGAD